MPKFGDIAGVWNTIRELNVAEIREEAEQPVTLVLVGESAAREPIVRALQGQPGRFAGRGGAAVRDAVVEYDLSLPRERQPDLYTATLIILAVDGTRPLSPELERAADKLSLVPVPLLVVCLGAEQLPRLSDGRMPDLGPVPVVFVVEDASDDPGAGLMAEIASRIPAEERVAAARRLPGLRDAVAREIIGDTSFSNATYALTSALPELVPVLNIPLNAADVLVLTKNQALMVYRLGLAYGAPPDFQAQMREIMPVIGGGFLWRQVARQLVGLVPGFGLLPKVAVAYAGTYAAGQAAMLWYSRGEVLSRGALKRLYKQALAHGRQRTAELLARRRAGRAEAPPLPQTGETRRLPRPRRGLRRFLPGRKAPQ